MPVSFMLTHVLHVLGNIELSLQLLFISDASDVYIKAKLVPSDDITVFYKTSGNLARVIPGYSDFIFATIKQPLLQFTTSPPSGPGINFIVSDNAKVNVFFFMWLLSAFPVSIYIVKHTPTFSQTFFLYR